MAHSRFSIPLFAVGLLAVAACMIYLVATKNIFGFTSLSNRDAAEGTLYTEGASYADESAVGAESGKGSEHSFLDIKKIKKVIASGAKKITGTPAVEEAEVTKTDVANSGGQQAVAETLKATTESNSKILVDYAQRAVSQSDYDSRLLWQKYSATIPRLYSHPRDENTEEILGRVGQLSMQLDSEGYSFQAESELIKIAAAGEREGARALSFQYMNPSLLNTTQALTWALIANAIAPNDYYLYICSKVSRSCTDAVFLEAAMQAQKNIDLYGFSRVQGAPSRME